MDEQSLKDKLLQDPGHPDFADYAEELRRRGRFFEAMEVCLNGLSLNPQCHLGRLSLARIMVEKGWLPFASDQVTKLCSAFPESHSLKKLLASLSPDPALESSLTVQNHSVSKQNDETVAEVEFDFDEIDLLEEKSKT